MQHQQFIDNIHTIMLNKLTENISNNYNLQLNQHNQKLFSLSLANLSPRWANEVIKTKINHQQKNSRTDCDTRKLQNKYDIHLIQAISAKNNKLKVKKQTSPETIISLSEKVISLQNKHKQDSSKLVKKQKGQTNFLQFSPRKRSQSKYCGSSKINTESRPFAKQRKNSQQIIINSRFKQILTQPISQSIFASDKIMKNLRSTVSRSFKVQLDQMLKNGKTHNTIHYKQIARPLAFSNKLKGYKKSQYISKYQYSKFYDSQILIRSKRNSVQERRIEV